MSENKFIRHLKGEGTAKSLLEVKNQNTPTSFANMPHGTSNANDLYSDHRGNATGVLKGSENWKLDGQDLVETTTVYGDGRDLTSDYEASGNGLWVDASFTFATARRFNKNTKFVLKLCGHDLDSAVDGAIDFTLLIKFGSTVITKSFRSSVQAFNFCKEFVVDFAESNTTIIKLDANDTMQIQLLCGDATAQAVIYNGMTVFTALQRRVDGDTVASDKKTFDEVVQDIDDINDEIDQIHEDIDDLEDYVDDTFVRLDGESIMTGPLKMRATSSFQCAIAPFWDGVGFYKLNDNDSVTLMASMESTQGFSPFGTNTYDIGTSLHKWKDLYLAGKVFVGTINNGADITIPATSGTMALTSDIITYTGSDGITLTGTNFTNSGVRSVASGTANGTISVNTNGTSADVSVTGLGSAAYTASSDYATAAQGTLASTAVQPGDLATVATTGDYDDLLDKPTIPAAQVNSDWNAISGVAEILNKPTTLSGYGITDGANTDLSNLTSTGKGKLGPVVYRVTGQVLNSANTTVTGIGDLYVSLYPNGIAVIEYTIHGTNGGGTDTDFSWGINRDLISVLNNNIPSITPLYGSCHFYSISSGAFSDEKNQYGGYLVRVGQFWQPGRVYDASGNVGGWPTSKMGPGTMIFGTAYGTYTV